MTNKTSAIDILGAGEPLLLLHGALVSRAMWRPQWEAFNRHFQVIACDLPAHGAAPDIAGEYTVQGLAASIIQVLDNLGIRQVHVCGHSLGGMVAQQLAVTHPQRVGRLVLAETAFGTRNSFWERLQTAIAQPCLKLTPYKMLVDLSAKQYGALHPRVGEFIRQEMSRYDQRTSLRVMGAALTFAGKQQLKDIATPTLVLVGTKNRQTHTQAREMAARIPSARLEIIPDAHHLLNLDNPNAFNRAVLAFLQEED